MLGEASLLQYSLHYGALFALKLSLGICVVHGHERLEVSHGMIIFVLKFSIPSSGSRQSDVILLSWQ
jgi:hypothetical protein